MALVDLVLAGGVVVEQADRRQLVGAVAEAEAAPLSRHLSAAISALSACLKRGSTISGAPAAGAAVAAATTASASPTGGASLPRATRTGSAISGSSEVATSSTISIFGFFFLPAPLGSTSGSDTASAIGGRSTSVVIGSRFLPRFFLPPASSASSPAAVAMRSVSPANAALGTVRSTMIGSGSSPSATASGSSPSSARSSSYSSRSRSGGSRG
jgi:hypothetical protein